jgi:predicted SAM-dependent methyltransferase
MIMVKSETSKARHLLEHFCSGNGLDIGHGGDKIVPSAIGIDITIMYTKVGDDVSQLKGTASDLYWFNDNVLDYVYSSHLLEDFEDTEGILREWCRVIKPKGKLILLLPDQQIYQKFSYNGHHRHADFGKEYVKRHMPENMILVYETDIIYDYNFALVYVKGN